MLIFLRNFEVFLMIKNNILGNFLFLLVIKILGN